MGQSASMITDEPSSRVRAVNLGEVADVEVRGTARTGYEISVDVGTKIGQLDLDTPRPRGRSAAEAARAGHEPAP